MVTLSLKCPGLIVFWAPDRDHWLIIMTAYKHVRGWGECNFADGTKVVTFSQLALPDKVACVDVVHVYVSPVITADCNNASAVRYGHSCGIILTMNIVQYSGCRIVLNRLLQNPPRGESIPPCC